MYQHHNTRIELICGTHTRVPFPSGLITRVIAPYTRRMARFWSVATICRVFLAVFSFSIASTPAVADATLDAWQECRRWVDAGKISRDNGKANPQWWSTVVLLRLDGRIAGVGEAHGEDCLTKAASAALLDASQRNRSSASDQHDPQWQRMTLELESGFEPEPLIGATYAQAASEIEPALDGIAVRRGDQWALAHPSVLQALNAAASPEQTLLSLVLQLGLPARELADLTASERIGLYRFRTTRMVQPTASAGPALVFRGSRTQQALTPSQACIEAGALADSIVGWFDRSMIRVPQGDEPSATRANAALSALGLRGDYLPSDGTDSALCAPPAEQALSAYALARFASLNDPTSARTTAARALSIELLEALGEVSEVEGDPLATSKAVSWIVMAGVELGAELENSAHANALWRNALGTLAKAGIAGDPLEQALAAAALAAVDRAGRPAIDHALLVEQVGALWQSTERGQLVGVLGWLLCADRSLNCSSGIHADLARAARAALSRAQLGMDERALEVERVPIDLVGAFSLSGFGSHGASAQSARPGHALALMLADEQFTPVGEQFRARAMQVALIRFLRQLAYDEVSSYLAPDARRTSGALRSAPWDSRVSVAGNALALLCVKESEVALIRLNSVLEPMP